MSKLSLGSGNRNSQRYFPGWKYTGAASVCGDYSDKFSPPEPLKQTFIVSQSWRLKSKTVVLAAHTPTSHQDRILLVSQPLQVPDIPWLRAVSLLLSSPGHCLCLCLSPLPSSDKDSRLVGLGPTPQGSPIFLVMQVYTLHCGGESLVVGCHRIWYFVYATHHIFV